MSYQDQKFQIERLVATLMSGVLAGHMGVIIAENPELNEKVLKGCIETAQRIMKDAVPPSGS